MTRWLLCLALTALVSCHGGPAASVKSESLPIPVGSGTHSVPDYYQVRVIDSARLELCRSPFDKLCVSNSYVTPGDILFASDACGTFLFTDYVNASGRSSFGWVDRGRVERLQTPPDQAADWVGHWQAGASSITFNLTKPAGYLIAEGAGSVVQQGRIKDEPSTKSEGDFVAKFKPSGEHAAFGAGDSSSDQPGIEFIDRHGRKQMTVAYDSEGPDICMLRLKRVGDYLVVEDNRQCGWPSFTFDGVYRRAATERQN